MGTLPVHPWRLAPDGLATRRQLRAMGLRPGGQDVVAELQRPRRRRGPLVAYLYRIDRARPVRPMTPARWAALAKANTARRTCPACRRDAGYVIPPPLGMCTACAFPDSQPLAERTDMARYVADTARGEEPAAPPPRAWEPWGRPTGPAGERPGRTVTAQPGHRRTRKPKAS